MPEIWVLCYIVGACCTRAIIEWANVGASKQNAESTKWVCTIIWPVLITVLIIAIPRGIWKHYLNRRS